MEDSSMNHLIRRRPKAPLEIVHVAHSLRTPPGVAESFNVSQIGIFRLQRSRERPECCESMTGECRDMADEKWRLV